MADTTPGITNTNINWLINFGNYCNQLIEENDDDWKIYRTIRAGVKNALQFELCFNGQDKDCITYPTKNPKIEL